MASIRITQFAGILPEVSARLKPVVNAQTAHNCLLTDGSLRPQAKWVQQQEYDSAFSPDIRGVAFDWGADLAIMYASFDPVTLTGAPFATNTTVGASPNSIINRYKTGVGLNARTVSVYGDGVAGTITYERSYDSIKPVNRMYAVTRVRRIGNYTEEGPLIPIPGQSPTDVIYEGDLVTVTLNASALDDDANFLRLYRTISGLDTGIAIANDLDTNWHLVDELPLFPGNDMIYIDGAAATALPLDVVYSDRFHPPELVARYFGLSEGGWFVAGSLGGDIAVSERYKHHAYPVENYLNISQEITDMAVSMDNVFVGTLERPFIMSIAAADKPMQAALVPFGEAIPCLPGSMTPAPSGAIYASGQGLVALSREGMRVITGDAANAGDTLFSKQATGGTVTAKISNTSHGRYFTGKYYGFCEGPPIDDGFYLTTTLYPYEFTDSMASESVFLDSVSFGIVLDSLTSEGVFISMELRLELIEYDMPPNEDGTGEPEVDMHLQSEAEFIEGEINTILKSTIALPEYLETTAMLTNGELRTILIDNQMLPEYLDTIGALTDGSLT